MNNKEMYQQKQQAKLDERKAELDKLRAKAKGASAEAGLELNDQIEQLERKLADGKHKLSELAEAGDEAWDSVKGGVESAWKSLNTAFSEAASKF